MNKLKLFLGLMMLVVGLGGSAAAFAKPINKVIGKKISRVKAHTRTIKIKVDKNGFSPASIEVEAGHKLNLVFNRADKDNCGNIIVFPKLKIRKTLPVGKDVIVSLTPREAGNITFTCGMGIYKGSLVVAD
jgi:plastocyanin domain-containing protein